MDGEIELDPFDILKSISKRLDVAPYQGIYKLISNLRLRNTIYFNVPKDVLIYRLRPNEKEPFTMASEISFNPFPSNYGRVNLPNEPIFYGSINVPNTLEPTETIVWELIHNLIQDGHDVKNGEFDFTLGRWKLKYDMPVTLIGLSDSELKCSSLFLPVYEKLIEANKSDKRNQEIIEFFVEQFSKINTLPKTEYKITTAIRAYLFNKNPGVEALIYPSVRTRKLGYNIALTPKFVNRYLELQSVASVKVYGGTHCVVDVEKECFDISREGKFNIAEAKYIGKGRDWCIRETREYPLNPSQSAPDSAPKK